MKKPELVNKIFKELNYYTKQDIDEGTTAILELISESLQNRDRIEIEQRYNRDTIEMEYRCNRNMIKIYQIYEKK